MKKFILTLVILLVSSQVFAANRIWIPHDLTIDAIRSYGEGNTGHFVVVNSASHWEGCHATLNSNGYYYLPPNSGDAYKMLLSAKLTGQTVRLNVIGYDECQGGSTGHAVIKEIHLGIWR